MNRLTKIILILMIVCLPLLLGADPAMAVSEYLAQFTAHYGSTGSEKAGCQLCHQRSSGSNFNVYGTALLNAGGGVAGDITPTLIAVETLDSDHVGGTNLAEIQAGAQPGWCVATTPGCTNSAGTPPSVPLDPPATNLPPIARATANQVAVTVGQSVSLSGSTSSDPEGHALTYSWSLTRPAGSTAALSATNIVNPTFIPDVAGSYTATLVVNDGTQNSAPASVTITASVPNLPPVANAGSAQTVTVGAVVTLNGSASTDPEGRALTYSWSLLSKPTGSAATLANATTVSPTFTADLAGTYTAQLVVNDGTQNSAPASVTITANPAPNLPPVAKLVASTLAPNVGQLVTLDGSGSSDPEGHALTYTWLLVSGPSGSTATLAAGADAAHKTLTPDMPGSYVVRLTVNDGTQNSSPVTVTIGALQNLPPVANPGAPQTVTVGATVQLNGSGSSDPEGHSLGYAWVFVSKPAGSTATLSATNIVNPTFVADVAGQYVVGLVVNDSVFNSPQVNVVITVNPVATLPPGAATLISPTGSISTTSPTYTWNAVGNAGAAATWYMLWVNDSTGSGKIRQWYTAAQANCASGTGICSVTPATALAPGAGSWWIQTWNSAGYGPWSAATGFTVPTQPVAAILISPTGAISTTTPTYTWNAVPTATWYMLWVNDSTGSGKIRQWYTAAQAGCPAGTGTCSVTPATALAPGAGSWWIQTWNSAGYGPWSAAMNFLR